MKNVGLFVWIILATVMMGASVLAILLSPQLDGREMQYLLPVVVTAAVAAIPFARIISKRLQDAFNPPVA